MKTSKKTVIYARTTSKSQFHEPQLEVAIPLVKDISKEDLVYIVEHGVPSSSIRNGLQQLLDLISQDQVDTLIVYSRDRLTRSIDEYQAILKLIYDHGVKVIFTKKGCFPFTNDQKSGMLCESFKLQLINLEKANMSKRIKDSLKRKRVQAQ